MCPPHPLPPKKILVFVKMKMLVNAVASVHVFVSFGQLALPFFYVYDMVIR